MLATIIGILISIFGLLVYISFLLIDTNKKLNNIVHNTAVIGRKIK